MEAPRSLLMKKVSNRNRTIVNRAESELSGLNLELLSWRWLPEEMEKGYLEKLKEKIDSGENAEVIQKYFDGYVSLRNLLKSKMVSYTGYLDAKLKKLHFPENDNKFRELEKLALEKGYEVKVHSYNFQ